MAVAFDAAVELVRTGTTDPQTWTHTPSGTPRAIVVAIVHGTSATDHVLTVTYGGVSMARIVRATDTVTELGAAELWFLGASIPTGNQTVEADLATATTDDIHFVSLSYTAARDCEVVDFDSINENATDPSVTLQYAGRTCAAVAALYGGGVAPTSFTPNANCETVHDHDLGAFYSEVIRQTTPGTSDFAIGGTASADDVAYVALALSERILFDDFRQDIIDGLDSAQSEATGWNAEVRDKLAVTTVVRTSDTVVTVTLSAQAAYNITAQETITVTVPSSALASGGPLTGAPTLTVDTAGGSTYTLTADAGSVAVTGTAASLQYHREVAAAAGAYAITGTAAGLQYHRRIAAASASYVITGTDATLTYTVDRTLAADSGAVTVSGTAAGLRATRRLTAEPASYAITGTAAELILTLHGEVGSFLITGTPATLTVAHSMPAAAGSIAISGTSATLRYSYRLDAAPGSVAITGSDAGLLYGAVLTLVADAGSFAITGTAASLRSARKVSADTASFAVSGSTASLEQHRRLVAAAGAIAVTGTDASLSTAANKTLNAEPGAVTVSGSAASLEYARRFIATTGAVGVTGTAAVLRTSRHVVADPASFTITGQAAALRPGYGLSAGSGAFLITGTPAEFINIHRLQAMSGTVLITGTPATLNWQGRLELLNVVNVVAVTGTRSVNVPANSRTVNVPSIDRVAEVV